MGGLSPQHHGELNKGNIATERYAELRCLYADDPVALQQIDVYDPGAIAYHSHMREYIDALKAHDTAEVSRLDAWFDEHYPDV